MSTAARSSSRRSPTFAGPPDLLTSRGLTARATNSGRKITARLDELYPVDFHALIALAGGEADALVRLDHLHPREAERAGMQIDIAAAAVGHDEAEAFLVIEELDLAFGHRA